MASSAQVGVAPSPTTVTCAACFDEISGDPIPVAEDNVCEDCFTNGIKPQFYDALKDETKHPVRWGTEVLSPWEYRPFFTTMFLLDWECRQEEYAIPAARRLYCGNQTISIPGDHDYEGDRKGEGMPVVVKKRCGAFLGRKKVKASPVFCGQCKSSTCNKCSAAIENVRGQHICAEDDPDQDPFAGMKKGVDYQECPNQDCLVKVVLRDGCHSLRCKFCYTRFCYICGEKAGGRGDNSNHWGVGKCPRFGMAGDPRAIFDTAEPITRRSEPVTAEQQARIEEQIRIDQTPEGRLRDADLTTLMTTHHFILVVPHSAINNDAHSFIHAIFPLIDVYTAHLHTLDIGRRPRFQDRFGMAGALQDVRRLAGELGDAGFAAFPELKIILDTVSMAWSGQVESLRAIVRPQSGPVLN